MNERIKELAIKAGLLSADYNGFDSNRLTKSEEKFAELIVRECCDLLETSLPYNPQQQMIKKHFGIKE